MNKLTALIVVLAILGGLVYSAVFVVNEREQVIVTRFGAVRSIINKPGIYFKIPTSVVESLIVVEDRLLRYDLDDIRTQVEGGKFYIVDAFMTFRIKDLQKYLQSVSADLNAVELRLRTRMEDALRGVYGRRDFQAALSAERGAMMKEVRDIIRPQAETLGIEVVDVRIRRTDLSDDVSQQTYERMKAERAAIAAELRAKGQQEAQRLRAVADRKAVVLVADANKESQILQGEGDAERNRIFANAFERDPEFFEFYRSMSAYQNAMENSGATLVLSPDSEFFRFFKNSSGTEPTGGQ